MKLPLTVPWHLCNKSGFKAGLLSLLMFCFCFASSISLFAQAPTQQWEKLLGGNSTDIAYTIVAATDGGFLIGGTSASDISGDRTSHKKGAYDCWIVKVDSLGNKLWDKAFGGANLPLFDDNSYIFSIITTSDDGFLLGGVSNAGKGGDKSEEGRGNYDYWVIKIDKYGNKLWDKTLGGSANDELRSMIQTVDGGYVLLGESASGMSGDKSQASRGQIDFWVVKINGAGVKQWDKTYGGSKTDIPTTIVPTPDGGFLAGGFSGSDNSGDKTDPSRGGYFNYWVVKMDSMGSKQWDKAYGGSLNDEVYESSDRLKSILPTKDGSYLLSGYSDSKPGADKTAPYKGQTDYWIVKIDSIGIIQWDKTYGGNGSEVLIGIVESPLGGYVLAGGSGSGISGDKTENTRPNESDLWLIKINETGQIFWDKSLPGIFFENLGGFVNAVYGGYASAGYKKTEQGFEYLVIKTTADSTGILADLKINFQNPKTVPPQGYLRDYGQAFGLRTNIYQGIGYRYGWKSRANGSPVDLSIGGPFPGNGRWRPAPSDVGLATFMHMQADDVKNFRGTPIEGYWEISVPNGNYQVTVSVGDGSVYNFTDPEYHSINIEGVNAINRFIPTGPQGNMSRFKSATLNVTVSDGLLTIDADGGQNTKINYAIIQPLQPAPTLSPSQSALPSLQPVPVQTIRASPNPFSDKFTLKSDQLSGQLDITLLDALGNQVYHAIHSSQAGEVWLEAASLKAGMYLIRIQAEDGSTQVMRVVKK